MRYSDVIDNIPEYPFAQIGRIANAIEKRDAIPVIRAAVGNPDREAPLALKQCMAKFVLQKEGTKWDSQNLNNTL